jgi:hypothetical protein
MRVGVVQHQVLAKDVPLCACVRVVRRLVNAKRCDYLGMREVIGCS